MEPKKPQVSLSGETFKRLTEVAKQNGMSANKYADEKINEALDREGDVKKVVDVDDMQARTARTHASAPNDRQGDCNCDLRHRRWNGNGKCLSCGCAYVYSFTKSGDQS